MRYHSLLPVKALFAVAICLFATVFLASHPARADAHPNRSDVHQVKEVGRWQLMCASEVRAADDCAIVQAVVDPRTRRDSRIAFSFTPEGDLRLRLRLWHIYGEEHRVTLLADGEQVGSINAEKCDGSGCSAITLVSESLAKQIVASKRLAIAATTGEKQAAYSTFDTTSLRVALEALYDSVSGDKTIPSFGRYRSLFIDQTVSPLISQQNNGSFPLLASRESRATLNRAAGFAIGPVVPQKGSVSGVKVEYNSENGANGPNDPSPIKFKIVNPGMLGDIH